MTGRLRDVDAQVPDGSVLRACWGGTVVFTVFAVAGAVWPSSMRIPAAVVAVTLFVVGCVAMLWSFLRAVDRSRFEVISVGGLYFLAGCAPRTVRVGFLSALAVQTTVGLVAAGVRPFTAAAFGVLAPTYALGLSGVWAALFGSFQQRNQVAYKRSRPVPAARRPEAEGDRHDA